MAELEIHPELATYCGLYCGACAMRNGQISNTALEIAATGVLRQTARLHRKEKGSEHTTDPMGKAVLGGLLATLVGFVVGFAAHL